MDPVNQVSVVIPNYNGAALLRENLPSVLAAFAYWGGEYEIIVVDDNSSDNSRELMEKSFRQVRLIVNDCNQGFSRSCNRGMAEVKYPVVFCINTDVCVEESFVAPVLRHFLDNSVFAVTPNVIADREGKNQGIVYGEFRRGFIKGGFSPIDGISDVRENLYAIGACVAYSMEKFRALGGYSEIYSPYLFEDVDISYRAWKWGWKSIYEPGAKVYHYSGATIGRGGKKKRRRIYFRNRFLFHWINLTDPAFILMNALHTMLRLAISFIWLDFAYYSAFMGALSKLDHVFAKRREIAFNEKMCDKDIIRRTGKKGN